MRRVVLGCAVLVAWLGLGAAGAAATVRWSSCYAQFGPFQCASVLVPLDYSRAQGMISIAVVRLPASDPARRIGSLFLNPGGPGGSGVDYALFAGPSLYTPQVRARFDLVGFDPRGVSRSTALRCFGTQRQQRPFFLGIAFPSTPAEVQQWIGADAFLNQACELRGGRIADHMSTANVARDLDVLRQAVGDQKLTYAGVSYGSYLGVTYANLFPDRVRALIVDGVLDPVAWATGVGQEGATVPFSTRLRSAAGSQATLEEFLRLCDAGGSACAFAPHAKTRYAALADRLKRSPLLLTFPDGSTFALNYSTFIGATLGAMYDSGSWEGFAQLLADTESQAASSASLGARFQRYLVPLDYGILKQGFPRYDNSLESFPGVACADTENPHDYAAWSAAAATAEAAYGPFGRLWTWTSSICAVWSHTDTGRYTGPFNHPTANPLLVIGNRYDPATPYAGAQAVAHMMPGANLLTLNGWGHTSLFLSSCIDEAITRYLVNLTNPAPGTVCAPDHVPFTTPPP
jgi:pimeloyl-ACP methyl ester carboxylesterase